MLKIIAAVAGNGVIGRDGKLPWKLPDDMRWFKKRTGSQPVVMGSKTFNSLPDRFRPLPGRENIVLARDKWNWIGEGKITIEHDFDAVLERAMHEDIWVMGGAELYKLALPHALELYLTRVHGEPEGDVYFPAWDPAEWILGWQGYREADDKHYFARTWEVYFRDTPIYQFANTRTDKQRLEMLKSLDRNECPFCPEGLGRTHVSPILWQGKYWMITPNDYPYRAAKIHLLIIPIAHIERMSDIPSGAWEEYPRAVGWIEKEYGMEGGAIAARGGNPLLSGSSIKHFHYHAISPQLGEMLSFPVGCKKTSEITLP